MEEKENVALDTVPKIFWNAVNTRKNKTAMREKDLGIWQSISWKEYGEKAKYIGLALNSLGLDKGDVVSIASEGIPEWLFTDLGVICVGGISSGVYTTDSSSQVEYLVNDSKTNFYFAENYHQDYLKKNPNGYCPDLSTGIVFDNKEKSLLDNSFLLTGKQILILDAQSYCPYCEKLKENVTDSYKGSIPLTYRTSDQLHGLKINSPTWATPSIIFLENGIEVFAYQGYIEPKEFYKLLGKFKLGNSEAYNVAFNKGTDARFCKEYEIFKNTPNGVFLDKLSGEPLFDTDDRFVSRSGWLSFTKPVSGSVYELPDNSYGMKRIEIRSVSSGIHLGHVFNDGPNGMPRYCINATVLEFKARNEIS